MVSRARRSTHRGHLLEVTSTDGTVLGARVIGSGPPLVLVHGSTADHTRWAPLVPHLRDEFTLVMLDRRGRGASSREASEYAIGREADDLLAVLAAVGSAATVFAHSYGATVTLDALDRLPAVATLLYEPPFDTAGHQIVPDDRLTRWAALLRQGHREAVLEDFYRATLHYPQHDIDALRPRAIWQARIAAVPTLVREAQALRAFQPRAVQPAMPVHMLLGDTTTPPLAASTRQAAAAIEGSELITLPGLGHTGIDTAPDLIAQHIRQI